MKTTDVLACLAVLGALLGCLQAAPVTKQESKASGVTPIPELQVDSEENELKDLQEFVNDPPQVQETEKAGENLKATENDDTKPNLSGPWLSNVDEAQEADVDLSPRAVAEYLLITGDFDGFELAINDLRQSHILTEEDVKQYKADVTWEYEALLRRLVDAESAYEQESIESQPPYFLDGSELNPAIPEGLLPTVLGGATPDMDEVRDNIPVEAMLNQEATLDQLLQGISEEYYTKPDIDNQEKLSEQEELLELIDLMKSTLDEDDYLMAGMDDKARLPQVETEQEAQMPHVGMEEATKVPQVEKEEAEISESEVLMPASPEERVPEKQEGKAEHVEENHDAEKELKAVLEQARVKEEKKRMADKKSAEKIAAKEENNART